METGSVWHSLQHTDENTTPLSHRFIPHEEADPNSDSCWVSKEVDEPLGLQLKGMMLTNVHQGSPCHKFGVALFKGKCLASINGLPVNSRRDVLRISNGVTGVWLGFSKLFYKYQQATLTLVRVPGPLGCFLEPRDGGVVVRKVATDTPASRAGLSDYLGFYVVAMGGEPVSTSAYVQEIWSESSPGEKLTLVVRKNPFSMS